MARLDFTGDRSIHRASALVSLQPGDDVMQVLAGERAVTIRLSYEDADRLLNAMSISGWKIMQELDRKLKPKMNEANKKGRPDC